MRGVAGLVTAEALCYTATRVAMIAIPWFVLESTGSPVSMGLVAFFEIGSYTLARLFGGPLLDRAGQRAVSVRADLVAAGAVACVPLLYSAGLLPFPVLLALVTLVGLATGPAEAAKVSMAPAVAERTGTRVERVTGLTGTVDRLSMTVGPVLAGGFVSLAGPLPALYANAVLLVAAAATLAATQPRDRPAPGTDPEAGSGYLVRLRTGWRVIWTDTTLRALVVMLAVTNMIDMSVTSVLLPVWVRENGMGPAVVGLMGGVLGAASVAGSLVATAVGHLLPRRAVFFAGLVVAGPPRLLVLALDVPLWAVLAVWGLCGLGGGVLNPILSTVLFERLPRHVVGRGTAMIGALTRVAAPLGAPVVGAALGLAGAAPVLVACAALYLVAVLAPLAGRAVGGLDAPEPDPGRAQTPG
ncbi:MULTISPECIES: MFS transporter [Nocardiopsis]|uniref:MFS transporter n=1 Tax=Nocardiopsis sinuspersici TaxID=501010 RepID=A0A1V3C7A5_9ACTN|nr:MULTISPECIES: MFS transporter [Nocardiopsis]OOC56635.1 MFS transporter [Nocardiopsis sinuspersici]